MKLAYGMPAVSNVSLTGGAWLSSDNGAALFDGKPGRASRINRTGALSVNITLASAIVPRVIALLGLNIPAGVTITCAGATATTRLLPDGSVAAWLFPSGSATASYVVSIATAQSTVDIGEIAILQAIDVGISDGWQIDRIDASTHNRTRGGQVNTVPGATWRRFTGSLSARSVELVRKGGVDGTDWETVSAALAGNQRGAVIPQHRDMLTGVFDAELAARTALYGYAIELPGATNVQRQYFGSYLAFEEIPA